MAETPKSTSKPAPKANQTKVVESADGSVHITQPKGKHNHGVTILLESDDVLRDQVGGFANFLRDYGVVGLAVGFIIGLQAQTMMKQFVDSFLTPLLNMWLGNNLSARSFSVGSGGDMVTFAWGKFLYAFINFLFVVLVIYLLVKIFKLDKLSKPKAK
jgi:large conductance mechanosensitive channel